MNRLPLSILLVEERPVAERKGSAEWWLESVPFADAIVLKIQLRRKGN